MMGNVTEASPLDNNEVRAFNFVCRENLHRFIWRRKLLYQTVSAHKETKKQEAWHKLLGCRWVTWKLLICVWMRSSLGAGEHFRQVNVPGDDPVGCTVTASEPLKRTREEVVLGVEIRLLCPLLINKVSTGLGITPLSLDTTEPYRELWIYSPDPKMFPATKWYAMPCKLYSLNKSNRNASYLKDTRSQAIN